MFEEFFDEVYRDDIENAINRVVEAYNFSQHLGLGTLYVAFSGGKDSVCLYGICKLAAEKLGMELLNMCEFHYNITNVDPPELVQFIKKEFPFVERHRPEKTMWQLIVERRMPPTRLVRYCCSELKERGGTGRFCVTGVRWAESVKRKSRGAFEDIGNTKKEGRILMADNEEDRRELEHCIPKNKYVCNPIVDWSDELVWHFIHSRELPYCKLYDEGFKRLGCIGCPMAGAKRQRAQFDRWPKYRDQYVRSFDRMLKRRRERGLSTYWETGEDVMEWWLDEKRDDESIETSELLNKIDKES